MNVCLLYVVCVTVCVLYVNGCVYLCELVCVSAVCDCICVNVFV